MHRPDLIASDVDGTLLDPTEHVTDRTARVISRVLASGTPFVLVSGRPPRWIPRVARAAGLSGYAVCANGASVYDIGADEVLHVRDLSPLRLRDIVRAVDAALPDIRIAAERTVVGRHQPEPFAIEHGFRNPWGNPNGETDSPDLAPRAEVIGKPATKLLVRHPGMTSGQMARVVEAVLADMALEVTYSSNSGLIEISERGVTKASGLEWVCEALGVDRERVVAFGDMPNDVPMLSWAGHGVAMANAHDDLLAVADEVTAPNAEDGVAQVLERWY
ncbi:HAD family hydrolase [Actinophytocola sp. NPDC049390]|uniref:HAD family hydrolase n=1 Tax=Actinophytocola sp. NPDC049390 TaxID=3363894 RepID=UPI0037B60AAC